MAPSWSTTSRVLNSSLICFLRRRDLLVYRRGQDSSSPYGEKVCSGPETASWRIFPCASLQTGPPSTRTLFLNTHLFIYIFGSPFSSLLFLFSSLLYWTVACGVTGLLPLLTLSPVTSYSLHFKYHSRTSLFLALHLPSLPTIASRSLTT